MKKSLIALAALAATSAFAQSSVTLYGRAEAGVDLGYSSKTDLTVVTGALTNGVVTGSAATTSTTLKPGFRLQDGNDQGQGTSRVGFRGTEDLGGGLKANFVMEMGIRIDEGCVNGGANCTSGGSGGANLFGRAAWVGVSSGFGEVRLGRQVLGSFGVHANGLVGAASSGLYEAGANIVQGGVRFSNAIQYRSPDFGGISGTISLTAPEGKTESAVNNTSLTGTVTPGISASTSPKTGIDLSIAYANGPIYVGFGYNRTGTALASNNNQTGPVPASIVFSADTKATDYAISASYNFGVAQPFFSYVNRKNVATGSTTTNGVVVSGVSAITGSGTALNGNNTKSRQYTLGVKVPVGPATLIAAYGNLKDTGGSTLTNGGAIVSANTVEGQTRAFQVGAQYPLSKRTTLQANYGINNRKIEGATATASPTGGTAVGFAGETKVRALNFGVQHNF